MKLLALFVALFAVSCVSKYAERCKEWEKVDEKYQWGIGTIDRVDRFECIHLEKKN